MVTFQAFIDLPEDLRQALMSGVLNEQQRAQLLRIWAMVRTPFNFADWITTLHGIASGAIPDDGSAFRHPERPAFGQPVASTNRGGGGGGGGGSRPNPTTTNGTAAGSTSQPPRPMNPQESTAAVLGMSMAERDDRAALPTGPPTDTTQPPKKLDEPSMESKSAGFWEFLQMINQRQRQSRDMPGAGGPFTYQPKQADSNALGSGGADAPSQTAATPAPTSPPQDDGSGYRIAAFRNNSDVYEAPLVRAAQLPELRRVLMASWYNDPSDMSANVLASNGFDISEPTDGSEAAAVPTEGRGAGW